MSAYPTLALGTASGFPASESQRAELLVMLHDALTTGWPPHAPPSAPARTWDASYAVWRLLHAWHEGGPGGPFLPDFVVLLRQAVRWHGVALPVAALHPSVAAGIAAWSETSGLRASFGHLEADPFVPGWLSEGKGATIVDDTPTVLRPKEAIDAEAYLGRLGFRQWNSRAQKEAVWQAMTAEPRSTTLIALPTGAGKSLCFQVIAAAGTGLTVVVVPTVALAIDHWANARSVFGPDSSIRPLYFAGDDATQPAELVLGALRDGDCRLLFASPEACVSGRLRPVLTELAQSGRLDALVIDEAHLADSWGMYFRVDFQVLAALRRQWLMAPSARVRTLLLSATFTPECRRTLRRLFGDTDKPWTELTSQRLRPELRYHAATFFAEEQRERAVMESLWHLPRPAILYTTTRADARMWTARIRSEGFARVACFDGETSAADRRALLERWRTNRIDVMVATSAFGMGVDKQDVRAVIHACLPEDLHRYYQEVGRSGRDGASSTCLLLPLFPRDREIAAGLAPRLMKPDTLARRWSALWASHRPVRNLSNTWELRTDSRPPNLYGEETGRRNIAWNKRLLLQLARAGLVDLLDVAPAHSAVRSPARGHDDPSGNGWEEESDGGADLPDLEVAEELRPELATVRVHFAPNAGDVSSRIAQMRQQELEVTRLGLGYMLEYLKGEVCIGRILRKLYGAETALACGGCPACRRRGHTTLCPPLPVLASTPTTPKRVVVAEVPSPLRSDQQRQFQILIRRLTAIGTHCYLCSPGVLPSLMKAVDAALATSRDTCYRVDAYDAELAPTCTTRDAVAVVHVGRLIESALHLQAGSSVYHLITSGTPHLDREGRRPLELDGVPYIPHSDSWALES